MQTSNDLANLDFDRGVRERLRNLLEKHPQAEISRKTGTTPSNVSRYLNGTRIPADFCAALVKGLEVNPSWLLSGEGTPMLGDVSAATASMGKDMLQLVEAMNAVTQMRLGALMGKEHTRVLRSLNESLQKYEQLKQRLNEHSRDVFAQVLKDLSIAITKRMWERVPDLIKAAEQVSRLSEEPKLQREFLSLQAYYQLMRGRFDLAAEIQRKVFVHALGESGAWDEEQLQQAKRLGIALDSLNKRKDAVRVWKAAAVMTAPELRRTPAYATCRFFIGYARAMGGDLAKGIAIMHQWFPLMPDLSTSSFKPTFIFYDLHAGTAELEHLLQCPGRSAYTPNDVRTWAIWTEDPRQVKVAMTCPYEEKHPDGGKHAWESDAFYLNYTHAFSKLLQDRNPAAARGILEATHMTALTPELKFDDDFTLAVYRAQIERLCGNFAQCERYFWIADEVLRNIPDQTFTNKLVEAGHHRNAAELAHVHVGGERIRKAGVRARRFFIKYMSKGFGCLRPMVDQFCK